MLSIRSDSRFEEIHTQSALRSRPPWPLRDGACLVHIAGACLCERSLCFFYVDKRHPSPPPTPRPTHPLRPTDKSLPYSHGFEVVS